MELIPFSVQWLRASWRGFTSVPNVPLLKDKRLKTVPLFENEVDLIVGDEEEKRLASRHETIKI